MTRGTGDTSCPPSPPAISGEPTITLDPSPDAWPDAWHAGTHRADETALHDRATLGLPTDAPVIMAGHQAQFWHPGIAAKAFAARALAERLGGVAAWLVIDTVDDDPASVRVPVQTPGGGLDEQTLCFDPTPPRFRVPSASRAAFEPTLETAMPETGAEIDPRIVARLQAMRDRLQAHAGEASAAMQVTRAAFDLLGIPSPVFVRSSELHRTRAFRALVERTQASDVRTRYNRAVGEHPEAGVQALGSGEIPFWRLTDSGLRLPANSEHADELLWPRALATTGLARVVLCDLFIHGTGGRTYEPINDEWLPDALGRGLSPAVTATATMHLPFEGESADMAQATHATWAAHHARHQPALAGDSDAQGRKDGLVSQIAALPSGHPERGRLYAQMQTLLDAYRSGHAPRLAAFDASAAETRRRAGESAIRLDRTWAAAIHEPERVRALHDRIAALFAH